MRILKISDVYFPRVNGVSTSIQTFQQELSRSGHDVHLIAPTYPAGHPDVPHISRIDSRYLAVDPEDRLMKRAGIFDLLPQLRERQFDLVHVHTPFLAHYAGVELARRLDIPVVETYHTFFEEYLHHYVPLLPKALTRRVARGFSRSQCNAVDAVVVPSTAMRDVLWQYGCTSPVHICPTGIQLDKFGADDKLGRARFRAKHGIAENRPMLLHVGRVAHEKNIGFLLNAVAKLKATHPDVLFLICGEGPARADLQRRVRSLGLDAHVMFIGYLDRETELLDCYRAADIFIFGSCTETQGLVLLEAMALGVPIVSTAVMGTIDILSANRGALVASEEVGDFAGRIAHLLDHPSLRALVGQEGRLHAQSWAARPTADRLAAIYEAVVAKRPAPAFPERMTAHVQQS
jgi:1,2-diacylglycerol 3-alpha-glucosyltransferase